MIASLERALTLGSARASGRLGARTRPRESGHGRGESGSQQVSRVLGSLAGQLGFREKITVCDTAEFGLPWLAA
jgi:hypothetical protein